MKWPVRPRAPFVRVKRIYFRAYSARNTLDKIDASLECQNAEFLVWYSGSNRIFNAKWSYDKMLIFPQIFLLCDWLIERSSGEMAFSPGPLEWWPFDYFHLSKPRVFYSPIDQPQLYNVNRHIGQYSNIFLRVRSLKLSDFSLHDLSSFFFFDYFWINLLTSVNRTLGQ